MQQIKWARVAVGSASTATTYVLATDLTGLLCCQQLATHLCSGSSRSQEKEIGRPRTVKCDLYKHTNYYILNANLSEK